MTARDAFYWASSREARNRILGDDTLSPWEKSRIVGNMDREFNKPSPDGRIPFSSVVRSLVGGTIGYAGAALGGRMLGMSGPGFQRMKDIGFGLGAVMNSGYVKAGSALDTQEDIERAFMLGFVKRAHECGYFDERGMFAKRAAAIFAVTPGDITSIPAGIGRSVKGFAGNAGAIAGSAFSPSGDDVDLTEMELEESLLREELAQILAKERSRRLKRILRQRAA